MDVQKTTINAIRVLAAEAIEKAKSGHPGLPLGCAPIAYALYQRCLKFNPRDPKWDNRDRFVLSAGHGSALHYALLHLYGFGLTKEDLMNFRQLGSKTPGHPEYGHTVGVETTTGPLGQGIANAVGMAVAAKMDQRDSRVYAIVGDGESEEGQVWEALMFAARHKLDNLCVIIDYNGLQIDGRVADIVNPAPFESKMAAFGLHVITVNAHDFDELERAFEEAKTVKGQPTAIIANSVKGKGVSFMEDLAKWHGSAPNDEQYEKAVAEIQARLNTLG